MSLARVAPLVAAAMLATTAWAYEPDYANPEQAFEAVFIRSGLGARAYLENREYAAAIYEMPDGRWHATAPVAGDLLASRIPYEAVPSEAVRIAGAHTHGQPFIEADPTHQYGTEFSEADRRAAFHNYTATRGRIAVQFLLTSRLELLRMTISRGYDADSRSISVQAQVAELGNFQNIIGREHGPAKIDEHDRPQ